MDPSEPVETASDSTNQRILVAARQLFARRGFKGTTTRAIAREAGVNEVTVFRLWGTKETLLGAVLTASMPQGPDAPLAEILNQDVRSGAELEAMLIRFMEVFSSRILPSVDDLLQIALKESGERPEFLGFFVDRTSRLVRLFAGRLAKLEGSLLRPGTSEQATEALVQFLIGRHLLTRNDLGAVPHFQTVAQVLVRGVAHRPDSGF